MSKPNFYKSLFWDVDPAKIDHDKHSKYVIERECIEAEVRKLNI